MYKQAVAHSYALDGVLTLVDAKHIGQHLDERKPDGVVNEALSQVAYADRIILNKTDLVRVLASATSYILLLPARLKEAGCNLPASSQSTLFSAVCRHLHQAEMV